MKETVHLVLHPQGIAPIFFKLDSWLPGAGFIPIISIIKNQIKKGNCKKKKLCIQKDLLYFVIEYGNPCGCNSTSTERNPPVFISLQEIKKPISLP